MSGVDLMRRTPRYTVAVAVAVAVVALAACGGSSASDGTAAVPTDQVTPDVSVGDVPAADDPVAIATEPAPTSSLVPSAEADLPTAAPGDTQEVAPSTTVQTGPLPIPAVQLLPIGEFQAPVGIARHPTEPRMFVVEQSGVVLEVDDESARPVLDLSTRTDAAGERGLLGLAFHPERDLAYVNYTDVDGNTVVAEFAIDPTSERFVADTLREVLTVEQPFGNHNGGALAFGPDGYLYIGLGDGGSADDPLRAGLDLSTRLGKLLRIDPIGVGDEPFVVPPDNPFVDVDGADPTIWSFGLRNPWRISFDLPTGDLWIADVGQNELEEVNRALAVDGRNAGRGLSFGWSAFEGTAPFNADQDASGHTPPVFEYAHADGNCSISGGVVARDSGVADLDGWYVYGDYCTGTIWGYDPTSPPGEPVIVELAQLASLTSIAIGPEDELYAVSNAGVVARIAGA